MLGSMSAALYRPLESTSCRHRPWQVAAAVAMGVGCGLLLMESPLGALGLVALFFLPVHLPAAISSALLTAGLAWSIEPAMGQVGGWLLGWDVVRSGIAALYEFPLIAWLRLNNTVVAGGVLLAFAQFIPTFVLTRSAVVALMSAYRESDVWLHEQARTSTLAPEVGVPRDELALGDPSETQALQFSAIEPSIVDDTSTSRVDALSFQSEPSLSHMPLSEADDPSQIAALLDGEPSKSNLNTYAEEAPAEIDFVELSDTSTLASSFEKDVAEWVEEIEEQPREAEESHVVAASREQVEATDPEGSTLKEAELDEKAERVERHLRVDSADLNAEGVAKRASELAALVDEMLEVIQSDKPVPTDSNTDSNSRSESTGPSNSNDSAGMPINSSLNGAQLRFDNQHPLTSAPTDAENGGQQLVAAGAPEQNVDASKKAVTFEEVAQHEEALRYLLHHLKEIKDKA